MPPAAGPHKQIVLETSRLILRELSEDDAEFILRLLNEPSFLRFVGDKGVRTVTDARDYIMTGPRASYARNGYGLNLVVLRETGEPIGICGLLNRDWLEYPDLGFSLLPAYWRRGYAFEAATAVLAVAESVHRLRRVLAFTNPDNVDSIQLLGKLGFTFLQPVRTPEGEELSLFARGEAPAEG
jgi:RimJ/RimL family protein N-acetyltransferase